MHYSRRSYYGPVKLAPVCPSSDCVLTSPDTVVQPVSVSTEQVWGVWHCLKCRTKGFVALELKFGRISVYYFSPESPIAKWAGLG